MKKGNACVSAYKASEEISMFRELGCQSTVLPKMLRRPARRVRARDGGTLGGEAGELPTESHTLRRCSEELDRRRREVSGEI